MITGYRIEQKERKLVSEIIINTFDEDDDDDGGDWCFMATFVHMVG